MLYAAGKKAPKDREKLISDIPTVQAFLEDPVPAEDVEKIVMAGVNAQSAINKQPWHFSVVTNRALLDELAEEMKSHAPKMPPKGDDKVPPKPDNGPFGDKPAPMKKAGIGDSPLVIIVSAKEGSAYDAGLATEMMTAQAVLLGYGTKIISSPTIVLNGPDKAKYQKKLGIPEDMSVVGVILIGKDEAEKTDAVTSASVRKDKAEIVTYVK